jgi:hypothetical protein
MSYLEVNELSELPQEIIKMILELYSHFRNYELWDSRFNYFLKGEFQLGHDCGGGRCDRRIPSIIELNRLNGMVGYTISGKLRYVKSEVDFSKYRIKCIICGQLSKKLREICTSCNSCYCIDCRIPQMTWPDPDGLNRLKDGCRMCKK